MAFLACIQEYKISQLYVVPPILVFLAKHPICDKFDLSSLRKILSGAAPAGKDICDAVLMRYPGIQYVEQAYGMTGVAISHMPDRGSRKKFGSCGKLAYGLQMKIVDVTTGSNLTTGKVGEICIRGPTVMKGYLGREEATRECILDGWMHTEKVSPYKNLNGGIEFIEAIPKSASGKILRRMLRDKQLSKI